MRGWILLGALILPGLAQADCAGPQALACPVEGSGKILEVCVEAEGFTYSFGPAGAPELTLAVDYADLPVIPWAGVGRAIWSAVRFPAKGFAYEVWLSQDRLEDDHPMAGGVNVLAMPGEDIVAQIECRPGPWFADVFVLQDAMAAAGYCWDYGSHDWLRGDCS